MPVDGLAFDDTLSEVPTPSDEKPTVQFSFTRGATLVAVLIGAIAGARALVLHVVLPAVVPALVWAPNHGGGGREPVAGELRVDVGPPAASLAIALVEPTDAVRGTVFVLHGIRDRKEAVQGWGEMLAAAGYRAVLVDLRGHGRSSGAFLSYGVIESRDLVQVLDALASRGLRTGSVGVMGMSYGAATAIEWAAVDSRVKAIVAIAPFASLRAVVPGYLPFKLPSFLVNRCIDAAAAAAGFDPDRASPTEAITKTRAPLLLIHGGADDRIPSWHSKLIAAAAVGRVELVVVPSADHGSITGDPSGVIRKRAPEWFDHHLAKAAGGE
jgi:pimeloyl-ACP methyl ester carboxylesterase